MTPQTKRWHSQLCILGFIFMKHMYQNPQWRQSFKGSNLQKVANLYSYFLITWLDNFTFGEPYLPHIMMTYKWLIVNPLNIQCQLTLHKITQVVGFDPYMAKASMPTQKSELMSYKHATQGPFAPCTMTLDLGRWLFPMVRCIKKSNFIKSLGPLLEVNRMWTKRNDHALKSECVALLF